MSAEEKAERLIRTERLIKRTSNKIHRADQSGEKWAEDRGMDAEGIMDYCNDLLRVILDRVVEVESAVSKGDRKTITEIVLEMLESQLDMEAIDAEENTALGVLQKARVASLLSSQAAALAAAFQMGWEAGELHAQESWAAPGRDPE